MVRLTTIVSSVGLTRGTGALAEATDYGSLVHTEQVPNALFLKGETSGSESFELRRAICDHDIKQVVAAWPRGSDWSSAAMSNR
jgi:hypothetical protein